MAYTGFVNIVLSWYNRIVKTVVQMQGKLDAVLAHLNEQGLQEEDMQTCIEGAVEVKIKGDKEVEAEKNRRKASIIVHGVFRLSANESDLKIKYDKKQFKLVMRELIKDEIPIQNVIRLGKRDESGVKSGPMKVVLESEEQRETGKISCCFTRHM